MSDQGEIGNNSGEHSSTTGSNFLSDKRAAVGIGAVVGGLSTLAATLSIKELLQDNPFVALAVFALLGAFLVFAFALQGSASKSWPVASFAIALLCTGIAAGTAAVIKGPTKVKLVVSATPSISDAKPVKFGQTEVGWSSPTALLAGGDLTLDLTGIEAYYSQKQKAAQSDSERKLNESFERCLTLLEKVSPKLNTGPGTPGTATQGQAS